MKPKPFTYTLKQLITAHFSKHRRPNVHNLCKFLSSNQVFKHSKLITTFYYLKQAADNL